jgi:lysophospholipase L1-like esterase
MIILSSISTINSASSIKEPQLHAPQRKSWLSKVFPYLLWQIIAILLVEFILFAGGIGEEEIFKLDKELGFIHMQNKRITWKQEGFAQSYFNHDGMREPNLSIEKPAHTYRVAFLGDSIIESLQVPIEKSFGQIIQNDLSQKGNIQVINFGTSGYSTAQEYIQLKRQVLKYKPDLIILGYNSRDMFENWSPADQVITDVRPIAVHLPNGNLFVNSFTVTKWLKSPRARFLQQIEWVRHHSRIWGVFAAWELEASIRNPMYKSFINFVTHPKQIIHDFLVSLKLKKPNDKATVVSTSTLAPTPKPIAQEKIISKQNNIKVPQNTSTSKIDEGQKTYIALVTRTMGSLIKEMNDICKTSGAKFAIMAVPARSALCPTINMETSFCNITYEQEIDIIAKICQNQNITLINCLAPAKKLSVPGRESLYYSAHLNPEGQKFMASILKPFIANELAAP